MSASIIELQRQALLEAIRSSRRRDPRTGQYIEDGSVNRIIVMDDYSASVLANVAKKHEIMDDDVLNIMTLDDNERRHYTTEDAVYLLSPQPYVIDYLKDDLNQGRHQQTFVLWTSQPSGDLCKSLHNSRSGPEVLQNARTLWVDFFPLESRLVILREPDSFQICFNKACDAQVMRHLYVLAHKIASVCLSLGETPTVRYYKPPDASHRAAILCQLLAERVQNTLNFVQNNARDTAAQPQRPKGVLIITDRSMDMMAPFIHETTYQAMAVDAMPEKEVYGAMAKHDVSVVFEDEKKPTLSSRPSEAEDQQNEAQKDRKLDEEDEVWVQYRHKQTAHVLENISRDFKNFRDLYPEFSDETEDNIRTLQTKVANLHEYMRKKATWELHINLSGNLNLIFGDLIHVINAEQLMATETGGNGEPAKHVADQLVQLLDSDQGGVINPEKRLRLLILYILYRGGVLRGDLEKLRQHADLLSDRDRDTIYNLSFLGARIERELKRQTQNMPSLSQDGQEKRRPLFQHRDPVLKDNERGDLTRYQPAVKYLVEAICTGTLDSRTFPFTQPDQEEDNATPATSQSSLRTSNKPSHTWANRQPARKSRQPRQRIIVFMAGGATFAESRACYEATQEQSDKEVFLITPEMLKPSLFLEQVGKLHLRPEQVLTPPPRKVFQPLSSGRQARPQPPQQQPGSGPPVDAMQNTNLGPPRPSNGQRPGSSQTSTPPSTASSFVVKPSSGSSHPLKEEKEKKRKLFGLGRRH